MKNPKIKYIALLFPVMLVACQQQTQDAPQVKEKLKREIVPLVEKVLSPEERSKLTPDMVLESLKEGNERFINNDLTARDHSKQVREAALGQFPKAIVLTCIDSRIPVEDVFDRGIGDIFVSRIGGNVLNEDVLGGMEFACRLAGAKLVMVLGHEQCGAILAAIDRVELGNMTGMIDKIKPSIANISGFEGANTSMNPEFVEVVAQENVHTTVQNIREKSPILQEMEEAGDIKIVGAYYDLNEGQVMFLE